MSPLLNKIATPDVACGPRWLPVCALIGLLTACATTPDGTLKSLEARRASTVRAIAEADPRRAPAPPSARAASSDAEDQRATVRIYEERLRAFPHAKDNDRILYKLAQLYDELGDTPQQLATLNRLLADYPASSYRAETHFRRGEIAFTTRAYREAELAYAEVLRESETSPFHERALYMRGWSLFKQGRLNESLSVFLAMLDRKLAERPAASVASLDELPDLTRGERELIEDTLRVISLSFAGLDGADSIPGFLGSPTRQRYAALLYRELGALYLKQERVKDAADTLAAFARRSPADRQAPFLQLEVIEVYQRGGFAAAALTAKQELVARYASADAYRKANGEAAYQTLAPHIERHLEDLARHYHAAAQKDKKADDYRAAERWYRQYLDLFPGATRTADMNFLLAELLFEQGRFDDAIREYERSAYHYPAYAKSADAGYGALLAHARAEKAATETRVRALRTQAAESALRFAAAYPQDGRVAGALAGAAEKFYALGLFDKAASAAQSLLALPSPATAELRRIAWTIVAHTEFHRGAFEPAERAYCEALALTTPNSPRHAELTERLAAALYKQGEQARGAGQLDVAADRFQRVAKLAPRSSIRANADYDAATALIALKDWRGAIRLLEDFRRNYPAHTLQADVPVKLAVCYLESGEPLKAATELETVANDKRNAARASQVLWQAAELYENAGQDTRAGNALEKYLRTSPLPFAQAIEARHRLVEINRRQGRHADADKGSRELVAAETKGGAERNARTRYLGALHTLYGAEQLEQAYRAVRLIEPLQRNLKLKKDKMQQVLQAYTTAAAYHAAETVSEITYRNAELYRDFAKALLESQRPKGLSKEEREQYGVLLEEQAFPFEEKAIALHEANARRVRANVYDDWVKRSFDALAALRPARYAKMEKSEAAATAPSAAHANTSGVSLRQAGKFEEARQAYATAIKRDSRYAYAYLNLGILYDLYLADAEKAAKQYRRYAELAPTEAQTVAKWIADVENRARAAATAQREKTQ